MQKKKRAEYLIFLLSVGEIQALDSRGEHCSPAKNHKVTFPLWYFSVTKSTKSHLRGFSILLKISFRVHELVAGSSAWQVRATQEQR